MEAGSDIECPYIESQVQRSHRVERDEQKDRVVEDRIGDDTNAELAQRVRRAQAAERVVREEELPAMKNVLPLLGSDQIGRVVEWMSRWVGGWYAAGAAVEPVQTRPRRRAQIQVQRTAQPFERGYTTVGVTMCA